jgi:hypothetical protein
MPFLAFLILLLLAIPFSFDIAFSVVPGWHIVNYPLYIVVGFIVIIVLLLAKIGYWLLSERTDKINWTLYAIHIALTIPTIIYLRFPSIVWSVQLIKSTELRVKLIPIAWTLFIVGQILFLIYCFRTINKTKRIAK